MAISLWRYKTKGNLLVMTQYKSVCVCVCMLTELQVLPALLPAAQQRVPLVGELQQLVADVGGRVVLPRQQLAPEPYARREVVLARLDLSLQRLVVVHQQLDAAYVPEEITLLLI